MKALLKKVVGLLGLLCHLVFSGCSPERAPDQVLQVVTVKQFEKFVAETGYVTDAEQFGWSIVQKDVFNFTTVDGADWRNPDGLNPPASPSLPVTQVSYNDAVAYCKWSRTALPTYEQYWELIQPDERMVVTNLNAPISSAETVNILGNVWEITAPVDGEAIRLAGGSLFCSPRTCHGTSKARKLYVDKQTGNLHIGFAVILAVQ
ncbi:MAG: SUMF1/EgtB/PvdO family nonheme iron enzyme [Bacteroidota bacterium]